MHGQAISVTQGKTINIKGLSFTIEDDPFVKGKHRLKFEEQQGIKIKEEKNIVKVISNEEELL